MTKEQFIRLAVQSGYASRNAAEAYANDSGKETFTEEDFIEVYHTSMRQKSYVSGKKLLPHANMNGRTTAGRFGTGEE